MLLNLFLGKMEVDITFKDCYLCIISAVINFWSYVWFYLSQNWREMPHSPLARKRLLENNYELTGIKACIRYFHQKGPGTSDQSLFRLRNKFRKTPLLIMYYLTKFDDVILSSFWVILKITSVNLCKPIYDINYSTSICHFESGKCEKEGGKIQKFEYLENEKSF